MGEGDVKTRKNCRRHLWMPPKAKLVVVGSNKKTQLFLDPSKAGKALQLKSIFGTKILPKYLKILIIIGKMEGKQLIK